MRSYAPFVEEHSVISLMYRNLWPIVQVDDPFSDLQLLKIQTFLQARQKNTQQSDTKHS